MKAAPDGIDERELSRALQEHWGFAPARLGYLPVGFDDHHWDLTDAGGRRWFVTVAGLTGAGRGTAARRRTATPNSPARRVSASAMRMCRMRWSLEEIMLSLSDFRGPHNHNEDTELTWEVLTEETENILQLVP